MRSAEPLIHRGICLPRAPTLATTTTCPHPSSTLRKCHPCALSRRPRLLHSVKPSVLVGAQNATARPGQPDPPHVTISNSQRHCPRRCTAFRLAGGILRYRSTYNQVINTRWPVLGAAVR